MSGGYNPKVVHPRMRSSQLVSSEYQTPFFFGGSQVPHALFLPKSAFNGSKGEGLSKGSLSQKKRGDYEFKTKQGTKIFHQKSQNTKLPSVMPFMR